jgi:SAM-dependent methyltransferase
MKWLSRLLTGKRDPEQRILPRNELHAFWRTPAPDGNVPSAYVEPVHRSRALAKLLEHVPKTASILEVGCNVGRNLAYLRAQGYQTLTGIEISPHAVELLRKTYPELADATIHVGAAEDVLPNLAARSFDVVFTMAVLEHIHPESRGVFEHIARVARELLTIEPKGNASTRQYPHDIVSTFEGLGLDLVETVAMKDMPDTAADPAIDDYFAWRFRARAAAELDGRHARA